MNEQSSNFRGLRRFLLGFAAVAGLLIGACQGDDDNDDDYEAPAAVEEACADYCMRAKECNDETDEPKCADDCVAAMGNCQVDELDQATAMLEQCANESCDDLIGCSINAGAECFFGL